MTQSLEHQLAALSGQAAGFDDRLKNLERKVNSVDDKLDRLLAANTGVAPSGSVTLGTDSTGIALLKLAASSETNAQVAKAMADDEKVAKALDAVRKIVPAATTFGTATTGVEAARFLIKLAQTSPVANLTPAQQRSFLKLYFVSLPDVVKAITAAGDVEFANAAGALVVPKIWRTVLVRRRAGVVRARSVRYHSA